MAQNSGKQRQKNVIGDPKNHMWAEACTLLKQAEQLHRQFFEPARGGTRTARWEPPVDVFETERQVWIIAALPGVAPEAGCGEVEGPALLIRGTRPPPRAGKECQYIEVGDPLRPLRAAHQAFAGAASCRAGAHAWLPRAHLHQARLSRNASPES